MERIDSVFNPASVAVVGASGDPGRIGYNILESIVTGGFTGPVYPVNSKYTQILGLTCYPDLSSVPEVPELVVLAVNQYVTVELAELCSRMGVKGIICPAGGFKEMGDEGKELEERLIAIARASGMALIGPNTLGLINTAAPLYATFYPMQLRKGGVSVISQSGGMGLSILALLQDEGVGVAKWCGVGNRGTLEFADYLNYLAEDPETTVIGVFMEGTDQGRAFIEAAAAVARHKPVVIFKGSRGKAAMQAAKTHTGTLAGSYKLYHDIFAQYELLAVDSVEELVFAMKALALAPRGRASQVGVLTHTAGPGIVAADALEDAGCSIPDLRGSTIQQVEEAIGPNPPVILRNPLDLAGAGFAASPYGRCAAALAKDPGIEAILAIYCHHRNWTFPTPELIRAKEESRKPMVVCYIGEMGAVEPERSRFEAAGIPLYSSIKAAAQGLAALKFYGGRE